MRKDAKAQGVDRFLLGAIGVFAQKKTDPRYSFGFCQGFPLLTVPG
jgi:hypothetical protein